MIRTLCKTLQYERTERYVENRDKIWDNVEWNYGDVCQKSGYVHTIDVDIEQDYTKIVPCGREDCVVCGREGSMLHKQRVMRGIKKILCFKGAGYFVFTVPLELRVFFRNQIVLANFTRGIKSMCKGMGYKRSVVRWHWGGDRHRGIFNPHLNLLVDLDGKEGWVDKDALQDIKKSVRGLFFDFCGVKMEGLPVVEYSYSYKIGWLLHKWKYICRPTLLLAQGGQMDKMDDCDDLANDLHGFRNIRWWGSWSKKEIEGVQLKDKKESEVANVLRGVGADGKKLHWVYGGRWKDVEVEVMETYEYLGSGVFVKRKKKVDSAKI